MIPTIADILMHQFGHEENVARWKAAYGAFCSQHADAVSIYKDILKTDRRFQVRLLISGVSSEWKS